MPLLSSARIFTRQVFHVFAFSKRKFQKPKFIFLLFAVCLLLYINFFTNFNHDSSWRSSLWDQQLQVPAEYLNLLKGTNQLILLEPSILAQIYVNNGTRKRVEQASRWKRMRWYFQKGRYYNWQSNRLTVGVFEHQLGKMVSGFLDLKVFLTIDVIICSREWIHLSNCIKSPG